ncbi:hypothetical protein BFL43_05890 [Williamsia sp. 1135]|nr:hypothetical protein BFL43_05890 [Williamsia sp. 1135]
MPWWGAVLIAVGLTTVGAVIAVSGDETNLGFSFKALYFVGCIAAVLAVRRRALFTAVAQPPLVLFGVAVIALYFLVSDSGAGLKKLVFDVALPVAKLFPLMGWTFVAVFAIGAARFWFTHPKNAGKPSPSRRSAAKKTTAAKSESTARPRRTSSPKPSMVKEDASSTAIPPRSRAGQTPRTPRPPEPRLRNPELGDEVPRRRRAAPEAPEPRRRHAGSFDNPPQPGARAYRSPDGYEPAPRLRHRDPH